MYLQKNEGKAFLASQLKLTCLEDDDNLRSAIYVDFLYDNLMFAVEKGFTWRQVCTVVTFCDGILKDSKGIITVVTPYLPASTHVSFVSVWWYIITVLISFSDFTVLDFLLQTKTSQMPCSFLNFSLLSWQMYLVKEIFLFTQTLYSRPISDTLNCLNMCLHKKETF